MATCTVLTTTIKFALGITTWLILFITSVTFANAENFGFNRKGCSVVLAFTCYTRHCKILSVSC